MLFGLLIPSRAKNTFDLDRVRVGKTIILYALERYFCRHYADWRDDTREHFTASVTADNLCLLSTNLNNVDKIYCYKNCDILFIDDAGAEKEKYLCYGNLITPVADIIDHRYIRRKKSIFTTNLVPAELCSRYRKDQEDLTLSPGRPDEASEDLLHSGRKDHDIFATRTDRPKFNF